MKFLNLKLVLWISALLISFPTYSKSDNKTNAVTKQLMLSITDDKTSYQIFRAGFAQKATYEFNKKPIPESLYLHVRDEFFAFLLKKQATPPSCPAVLQISLVQLKEKGLVCKGDLKNYIQAKAFLNELIRYKK